MGVNLRKNKKQRFLLSDKSKRREQKRREEVRNRRLLEHSSGCARSLLLVNEGRHSQSSPLPLFSSSIKVNTAGESLLCIQTATSCWPRLCKTAVVDLKFPLRVDQYPQHLPALLCACSIPILAAKALRFHVCHFELAELRNWTFIYRK